MLEFLLSSYIIPFHHQPLLSWELVKFPSYALGSLTAQALQAKVDETLEKGSLEVIDLMGPGYYSRLFLVQKVTGWRPATGLLALDQYMTLMPFRTETVALILWSVRKGDMTLSISLKDTYFQITMHPDSHMYVQIALPGSLRVRSTLLQTFHSSPSIHKNVGIGVRVGSQARDLSASPRLVDDCRFNPSSAGTLRTALFYLCKNLGTVISFRSQTLSRLAKLSIS